MNKKASISDFYAISLQLIELTEAVNNCDELQGYIKNSINEKLDLSIELIHKAKTTYVNKTRVG